MLFAKNWQLLHRLATILGPKITGKKILAIRTCTVKARLSMAVAPFSVAAPTLWNSLSADITMLHH